MPIHFFGLILMMISSFLTLFAVMLGFYDNSILCAACAAGAVFLGLYGLAFFGSSITADIILGSLEFQTKESATRQEDPSKTTDPPQE